MQIRAARVDAIAHQGIGVHQTAILGPDALSSFQKDVNSSLLLQVLSEKVVLGPEESQNSIALSDVRVSDDQPSTLSGK